jgi:uncharacterized protein YjbI with pentapeptide repeats
MIELTFLETIKKEYKENNISELIRKKSHELYGLNLKKKNIKNIKIKDLNLSNSKLENIVILKCEITENGFLNNSFFKNIIFRDLDCEDCFLNNSNFMNCNFINCDFINCDFSYSYFEKTQFRKCNMELSDYSYCNFQKTIFNDCNLNHILLNNSIINKNCLIDTNCTMYDVDIEKTKFPWNCHKLIESILLEYAETEEELQIVKNISSEQGVCWKEYLKSENKTIKKGLNILKNWYITNNKNGFNIPEFLKDA